MISKEQALGWINVNDGGDDGGGGGGGGGGEDSSGCGGDHLLMKTLAKMLVN